MNLNWLTAKSPKRDRLRISSAAAAFAVILCALLMTHSASQAQRYEQPHMSLYGLPGYLDMPSARFQSDGTLSITGSTKQPDDRITIAFQVTPWLEGTARYSVVKDLFGTDPTASSSGALYDRSLGFRARLWKEGRWTPQVALGLLDIGGTAIFGAEYLVASKKLGPVDTSIGLGFGRFGSTGQIENPLALVSDRFRERDVSATLGETGQFDFGDFFSGEDAAIFGGIRVETPIRGLNLVAEYSGDDYIRESRVGRVEIDSPFNFGLGYAPNNSVEFGVGYIGGTEVSLRMTLRLNLKEPIETFKLDPPPKPAKQRTELELRESILARLTGGGPAPTEKRTPHLPQPTRTARAKNTFISKPSIQSASTSEATIAQFADGIDRQIAPISYQLDQYRINGREAVFELRPTSVRPPLRCEEIWANLTAIIIPEIDRLTFLDSSAGTATIRCTRIIVHETGRTAKNTFAGRGEPNSSLENESSESNPSSPQPPPSKPATPVAWWTDPKQLEKVRADIVKELRAQRLAAEAILLTRDKVELYLLNETYLSSGKAIGRAARAITHALPNTVEQIVIVLTNGQVTGTRVEISRPALERVEKNIGSPEELLAASSLSPSRINLPSDAVRVGRRNPRFEPIFGPGFKQSLFDPDDPLRFQVYWKLGGTVNMTRNLSLSGVYSLDIWNNFDTITRVSDSVLPRVRSNASEYLKQGDNGIETLQLTYVRKIRPEVYGRISAGYLEDMFGGVSGEVLYRPFGKRWALGAEVSQVWQRDFDRGFGFQDYQTLTSHVSAYYDSPFYDLDFAVHTGRYLAGDDGLTLEVNRRFANGAQVGAFATFTDVSFERFGEGSFDKGVRIVIPLDLVSLFSTKRRVGTILTPLTRDGGARLYAGPKLYDLTYGLSYGAVRETWDDLLARR